MELSARTIALRSAALASAIFVMIALLQGAFYWGLLVACTLSMLAAAAFFRDEHPLHGRIRGRGSKPVTLAGIVPVELLAGFPDPVVVVDQRGIVVQLNPAARALFPLLVEARPLAFIVRAPAVLEGIDTVLQGGVAMEAEFREHGLVERTLVAHIAPLASEAREGRDGVMLVIRDLTSARRLEHMRADFVANASHELRTPLASLIGFIETLQGSARNDESARERFLVIMREQARRMSRLIDDLLSLSRIEMHLHVPPSGKVEMGGLVRHIIETLAPLAKERGVIVMLEQVAPSLFVNGDRDELLRVVENLIENAIKYGQAGGRVDVSVKVAPFADKPGENAIVMEVRDYGPGIFPEHLPRLTERFYRADIADSREKGGTGLGLAIVKHIVNRHRGRLDIVSRHGEGALFRVSLPKINNEPEMVS
ncbi:ATP-binding protein [Pseudochelatococcus sp. G4_1912]|uniref:ATP-binding protein n=1 Tax=Pseudochelatococcus sp. G4_1912 TaxID=3114288 RepID=UPI0039C6F3EB